MFVQLFEFIVSTRIGNACAFLVGALIFYGIFRLVVKIIDYIVFKRLMKMVMQAVFDLEDDEDDDEYFKPQSSYHEDEQSQKKDKKREQMREAERMQNLQNQFIGGHNKSRPKKRIVGFNQDAIIGKWTARVAKQMLQKYGKLDMNMVNEVGYFQALVMAQRGEQSISNGFRQR